MVDRSTVLEVEKSGSSKRSTGSSQLDGFTCHAEPFVGTIQAEGVLRCRVEVCRRKGCAIFGISVALLSSGCNSPDRVLDIPAALNTAPRSIEAIKDYQEALSAIVSVMVRELKLPAPQGRLYFYRDAGAYQAALAAELKTRGWPEGESKEIRQVRHQLEFELFKLTLNVATETGAVTMDQKVFIAEWSMMRLPWTNRVKTLAHELTH